MTSQDSPDFPPGPAVRIHLNGGPLDGEERTHHFHPKLYGEVGKDNAPVSVYQPAEAINGEPAVLPYIYLGPMYLSTGSMMRRDG